MKNVCVWWWWAVCIHRRQSRKRVAEPSQSFLKCKKNSSVLSIWSPRKMLNWLTTCSRIENDIICPLLWPWTFAFTSCICRHCNDVKTIRFVQLHRHLSVIILHRPHMSPKSYIQPYRSYLKLESHEISFHVFSHCQNENDDSGCNILVLFRSMTVLNM